METAENNVDNAQFQKLAPKYRGTIQRGTDANASMREGGGGSLLRAARSGNLEKLINLLDQENVDISTANSSGLTALHLAAKEGHNDVIIELLSRSADINQQTKRGNTALHIASLAGKLPVVQLLLEKGADPNSQAQNAFTPLYMAAQEGHEDIVDYLLKHGANQSISTEDGFTPLAVALQESKDKVVALLLDNDVKGKVKLPALHIASRKDDVKAAALLLQNDNTADTAFNMMVNRTTESGFTALHIAAHYGNVNVGTLLLNRGAIVDFQAKNGITPMHVAAKRGHTRFCSLLIDRNGRPDARTRDGLMPLHCAARFGHLPIVKLFLDNQNIPRFAKTKNGLSALHMTTQAGHTDVIELLLSRDFPVDDTTADYLSALHIATHCGHVEAATLLLKHGARFNCKALNGFTPLHVACKKNRIKMVELLLSYHADREAVTESGLTPLHIACFMGHFEIVELLIQKKSNLNSVNVRGETALHMATRSGQTEIVSYLLRHGAKPDTRKQESQTCLHLAARLDKLEILKILLKYGATLDAEMEDGYTPLHVGCKEGHVQVCEVLLDKGASVALTTKKGFTPLHLAAKYGRLEVTNLLLKNHSSPDACGKDGLTSLHVAAHFDNQQVALLLLKNGASPHASGKNGYTPLHIAAKKNQMEIALTLLEYGASPNCKTRMDVTPLHLASQEGHTDMCSILLAKDANVNTGAKFGLTPMHLAAQEDRISVAKVLYDNGSLVDPLTKAGCTPLHVASHHGNIKVANYLLSLGAKVNAKTKNGYTPLHQASQQGHTHVVNLLLQYGASPNELTNSGNTALSLAKRLGYLTVVDTLQTVTTEITTTVTDEKRRLNIPETVNEGFMSDASDDEADENMVGGGFLTNNEMRELGDDSIVPTEASMFAISKDSRYSTLGSTPVHHNGFGADRRSSWSSSASDVDNIKPARIPRHSGFLVSFMVDARGGAMRSTRNPEMRILVPPKACRAPTRVTCRLARRRPLPGRTSTSPSLYDSEGKASRVVEVGPKGTGFLEPVAIEIPHFAYVKENYRELVVMRSNDGETWKIHESPCTDLEFREQFKEEDLESVDDLAAKRVFRVITKDFPRFFAVVSRPLENSKNIGTDGSELASTVIKDAKVKFPEGSLTKKISVSIQVLLISSDVCRRAVGGKAKASAILTIEPRRRKFHKPITLTIPLPVDTDMKDYLSSTEDSTLRLLCSISGGSDPAQWEDITGSTPLNFLDNCVTFTSTVSARFWLIDCRQPSESSKLAHEIYKEATRVPYMAKFVVFAKSHDPLEGKLRIFCLTEERYEKTLENQENFTEVARSKDIEVTEGCTLLVECSGNLNVPFKSSAQQKYPFNAFSENRVQFLAKVRDSTQDPCGRLTFYRVPNGPPKTHGPRRTLCNLNVKLPPCDRASDSENEENYLRQAGEAGSLEQEAVEARRRYYLVDPDSELLEMDSPITDCISPQELDEVMSDDIKAEKLIYASHVGKALVGDSFYVDRPTMESIRDSVKAESFSLAGNMNVDKNESEKPVKTELVCDSENETKTNALTEEINCSPGTTVVLVKTNVTSYTDVVESQELDDFEAFEQRFCMDTSAKDTVVKSCAFVKKESTEGNSDNKCDVLPINNVLGQEESKNSEKHEENISSINTHVAISVSETELQDVFNDPISNQTKINDERDSLSSTDLMDSRPRNLSGVSELSKPTTTCAAFTDFNIQDESVKSNNLQTETRSKHLRMTNSDSPIDAESSLITENKMDVNKTETLRSVTTEIVSDSEKITEATTLTKETYDCPVNTVVSVKTNAPSYSDGIEPQQLHDFERLEQRFCMDYSANGTEASLLPTVVVKSPTHVEKDFPEHCRDDNSHVTHADDVLEQTITSTIPEENKVVYKHEDVGKGLESEDRTLHENQDLPSAQGEVLNEENEAVIEIEVDKHDIFKKDEEEESSINSCVVLSASQFDVRKIFADPISDETEMTEKHDRLSVLDVADSRPKVLSDITELSQPTATCATSMVVTRLDESPKSDVLGSEKGSKLSMIPSRDSRVEAECSSFTGNKININKTETQTSVKDEIFYDSENDSKANEPTEETNDSPVMAIASVKTDAPSYTDVIKRQELNDFETLEQRICINPSANATGVSLISTVVVKSPTFAEEGSTESYSDNKYDTTHGDGVLKQVSNSFVFEENDVTDKLEYSDKELVPEEGKLQKNRDEVLCKEKDALLEVGAEEDDILEENEEERSSVNFHVSISASQTDEQDFFDDLVSDETEMSEEHDSFSAMDHTNSRPRFLSDISELSEPTTTCARSIVFTTLDESPKSDILEDEIGSELSTTPSSDIGIEAEISLGLTETEDINKTETPVKEEIVCDSKNETKTKALTKGTNVMVTNIVSVKTDATSNTNVLETHEVDDFEALEQRFCIGYSAKATEASLIPTVVVKSPSLAEEDSTKCYSDDLPVADVFAQVITSPIFEENDVTENLKSVDEELALEEEKLQEKLSSPSLQGEVLGEEKDALFKIGAEESTFSEEVQEEKSSINTHVAISASHTDLGDFFNDPTSDKTKMNAECDSSSALDVIDGRSRALSDISELSELTRTSATSTVSTTQDETSESDTLESEKRSELSKTPCSDSPVEAESFSWTENMKINKTETEKPVKENIVSDSENEIKTIALTEETNEPSQSIVSVKTDVPSYTDVLETQELHDFETLEQRFCMDFSANGSGASLIPTVVVKSPTCAEEDSAERYSDNNYDVTHIDDILDQVITSPILKENDVTEKLEYVDKKGKLFENPNSRSVQGEVLCEEKDALSEDGSEEDEILEEDKEERSSVNFHVSISASQIDVRNFFDNPISNETKMSEEYDSVSALDVVDSRPRALSDISELSEPTATCATSMVITTRDEYPKSDIMGSENGIQVSTTPQSLDETKDIMFLPDEAAAKEATVKSDEANYMYPHVTNMVCINEQTGKRVNETVYEAETNEKIVETLCSVVVDVDGGEEQSDSIILLGDQLTFDESYQKPHVIPNETESNQQPKDSVQILSEANCSNTVAHTPDTPPKAEQISLVSPSSCSDEWRHTIDSLPNSKVVDKKFVEEDSASTTLGLVQENGAISKHEVQEYEKSESEPTDFETSENTFAVPDSYQMVTMSSPKLVKPRKQLANITQTWISQESDITVGRSSDEESEIHRLDNIDEVLSDAENKQETSPEEQVTQFETDSEVIDKSFKLEDHSSTPPDASEPNKDDFVSTTDDVNDVAEVQIGQIRTTSGMIVMSDATDGEKNRRIVGEGITMLERNRLSFDSVTQDTDRRLSLLSCTSSTCSVHSSDAPDIEPTLGGIIPYQTKEEVTYKPRNDQDGLSKMGKNSVSLDDDFAYSSLDVIENVSKGLDKENEDKVSVQKATQIVNEVVQSASVRATVSDAPQEAEKKDNLGETDHDLSKGIMGSLDATVIRDNEKQGIRDDVKLEETIHSMSSQISAAALHSALSAEASPIDQSDIFKDSDLKANKLKPVSENVEDVSPSRPDSIFKTIEANVEECIVQTTTTSEAALFGQGWSTIGNVTTTTTTDGVSDSPKNDKAPFTPEKKSELISATMEKNLNIDTEPLPERNACHSLSDWLNEDYTKQPAKKDTAFKTIAAQEESCVTVTDQPYELHGVEHVTAECDENYPNLQRYENPQTIAPSRFIQKDDEDCHQSPAFFTDLESTIELDGAENDKRRDKQMSSKMEEKVLTLSTDQKQKAFQASYMSHPLQLLQEEEDKNDSTVDVSESESQENLHSHYSFIDQKELNLLYATESDEDDEEDDELMSPIDVRAGELEMDVGIAQGTLAQELADAMGSAQEVDYLHGQYFTTFQEQEHEVDCVEDKSSIIAFRQSSDNIMVVSPASNNSLCISDVAYEAETTPHLEETPTRDEFARNENESDSLSQVWQNAVAASHSSSTDRLQEETLASIKESAASEIQGDLTDSPEVPAQADDLFEEKQSGSSLDVNQEYHHWETHVSGDQHTNVTECSVIQGEDLPHEPCPVDDASVDQASGGENLMNTQDEITAMYSKSFALYETTTCNTSTSDISASHNEVEEQTIPQVDKVKEGNFKESISVKSPMIPGDSSNKEYLSEDSERDSDEDHENFCSPYLLGIGRIVVSDSTEPLVSSDTNVKVSYASNAHTTSGFCADSTGSLVVDNTPTKDDFLDTVQKNVLIHFDQKSSNLQSSCPASSNDFLSSFAEERVMTFHEDSSATPLEDTGTQNNPPISESNARDVFLSSRNGLAVSEQQTTTQSISVMEYVVRCQKRVDPDVLSDSEVILNHGELSSFNNSNTQKLARFTDNNLDVEESIQRPNSPIPPHLHESDEELKLPCSFSPGFQPKPKENGKAESEQACVSGQILTQESYESLHTPWTGDSVGDTSAGDEFSFHRFPPRQDVPLSVDSAATSFQFSTSEVFTSEDFYASTRLSSIQDEGKILDGCQVNEQSHLSQISGETESTSTDAKTVKSNNQDEIASPVSDSHIVLETELPKSPPEGYMSFVSSSAKVGDAEVAFIPKANYHELSKNASNTAKTLSFEVEFNAGSDVMQAEETESSAAVTTSHQTEGSFSDKFFKFVETIESSRTTSETTSHVEKSECYMEVMDSNTARAQAARFEELSYMSMAYEQATQEAYFRQRKDELSSTESGKDFIEATKSEPIFSDDPESSECVETENLDASNLAFLETILSCEDQGKAHELNENAKAIIDDAPLESTGTPMKESVRDGPAIHSVTKTSKIPVSKVDSIIKKRSRLVKGGTKSKSMETTYSKSLPTRGKQKSLSRSLTTHGQTIQSKQIKASSSSKLPVRQLSEHTSKVKVKIPPRKDSKGKAQGAARSPNSSSSTFSRSSSGGSLKSMKSQKSGTTSPVQESIFRSEVFTNPPPKSDKYIALKEGVFTYKTSPAEEKEKRERSRTETSIGETADALTPERSSGIPKLSKGNHQHHRSHSSSAEHSPNGNRLSSENPFLEDGSGFLRSSPETSSTSNLVKPSRYQLSSGIPIRKRTSEMASFTNDSLDKKSVFAEAKDEATIIPDSLDKDLIYVETASFEIPPDSLTGYQDSLNEAGENDISSALSSDSLDYSCASVIREIEVEAERLSITPDSIDSNPAEAEFILQHSSSDSLEEFAAASRIAHGSLIDFDSLEEFPQHLYAKSSNSNDSLNDGKSVIFHTEPQAYFPDSTGFQNLQTVESLQYQSTILQYTSNISPNVSNPKQRVLPAKVVMKIANIDPSVSLEPRCSTITTTEGKPLNKQHEAVASQLGIQWPQLAVALGLTPDDVWKVQKQNSGRSPGEQSKAMMRMWINARGDEATDSTLGDALREINRKDLVALLEDPVFHFEDNIEPSIHMDKHDATAFGALSHELGSPFPTPGHVSSPYPFPPKGKQQKLSTSTPATKAYNELAHDDVDGSVLSAPNTGIEDEDDLDKPHFIYVHEEDEEESKDDKDDEAVHVKRDDVEEKVRSRSHSSISSASSSDVEKTKTDTTADVFVEDSSQVSNVGMQEISVTEKKSDAKARRRSSSSDDEEKEPALDEDAITASDEEESKTAKGQESTSSSEDEKEEEESSPVNVKEEKAASENENSPDDTEPAKPNVDEKKYEYNEQINTTTITRTIVIETNEPNEVSLPAPKVEVSPEGNHVIEVSREVKQTVVGNGVTGSSSESSSEGE
ncbi:unnamed protein product [Clavelina lepadiformis]|uniref:Ankyrin-3 n=1 Tax=Clavelina lepadiformis TaxID=159417 RepID=A0ABP0GHU3_CLALP